MRTLVAAAAVAAVLAAAAVRGDPPFPNGSRPTWNVTGAPDPCVQSQARPCGFRPLRPTDQAEHALVYRATGELGTHNHGVMIDYLDGFFLVSWKKLPQGRGAGRPEGAVRHLQRRPAVDPRRRKRPLPQHQHRCQPGCALAAPSLIVENRRYAAATLRQYSQHLPATARG